jgi:hypothetical protein
MDVTNNQVHKTLKALTYLSRMNPPSIDLSFSFFVFFSNNDLVSTILFLLNEHFQRKKEKVESMKLIF